MSEVFYWIIQIVGSETMAHGPYKSETARDSRYDNIHGGTVYKFSSFSSDPEVVKEEFKSEEIKRL